MDFVFICRDVYGTITKYNSKLIHTYYTPKFMKFQAFLAKTSFFVDYDRYLCQQIYVNYPFRCAANLYHFQLFSYIVGHTASVRTKYRLCKFSCKGGFAGKL